MRFGMSGRRRRLGRMKKNKTSIRDIPFGRNIEMERARLKAGFTTLRQAEAASGVSNPYISQIETGKIKAPSVHLLLKLSKAYNVKMKTVLLWVYPELRGEI